MCAEICGNQCPGRSKCTPKKAFPTQGAPSATWPPPSLTKRSVLCRLVAVAVGGGAGAWAPHPLALTLRPSHDRQLGRPHGTVPVARSQLVVAILGWAPRTLRGPGCLGVLLGEKHRCSPANFMRWSGRGVGTKAWNQVVDIYLLFVSASLPKKPQR